MDDELVQPRPIILCGLLIIALGLQNGRPGDDQEQGRGHAASADAGKGRFKPQSRRANDQTTADQHPAQPAHAGEANEPGRVESASGSRPAASPGR